MPVCVDPAAGGGEVVLLRRRIDVDPRASTADGRGPSTRIDGHLPHRGEVDDDALTHRRAGDAVTTAAHRNRQAGVASDAQRLGDFGSVLRPGDRRRPHVDHRVEDRSGGVVTGIGGGDHLTGHRVAQLVDNRSWPWHSP